MAATKPKPAGLTMPGFAEKLSDRQIADVVNYIRNAWGNRGSLVDANTVADVRKAARNSPQGDPGKARADLQLCSSNAAPGNCRDVVGAR